MAKSAHFKKIDQFVYYVYEVVNKNNEFSNSIYSNRSGAF